VLARAVIWGMLDVNPAKHGVENPQRRRTEKRPFESWDELEAVADRLGPRHGPRRATCEQRQSAPALPGTELPVHLRIAVPWIVGHRPVRRTQQLDEVGHTLSSAR
jgi:hypothetical protein